MKQMLRLWIGPAGVSPVVVVGQARLVRNPAGGYELRGGTPRDRSAIREWISLFQHDIACANELPRAKWSR
jgi:hypothetical protein